MKIITTPDKMLRELNIIDVIFKSQFKKQSEIEWLKWPNLVNNLGKSIDGKCLFGFSILSNVELFSIQQFKKEITERYEKAVNLDLLKSQLTKIRNKAELLRDYYNENLTVKNETVKSDLEKHDANFKSGNFNKLKDNKGVIEVLDYYVSAIHFGVDDMGVNQEFLNYEFSKTQKDKTSLTFNYPSNNHQLASVCQILIDFIEEVRFIKKSRSEKQTIPTDDLNKIYKKLIDQKFLTSNGENAKAKPLIAALLSELSKVYKTDKSRVLRQIAPIWKLSSSKTKNFKSSQSKEKLKEYESIVGALLAK